MSETNEKPDFNVRLRQIDDFEFAVRFDLDDVGELAVDEPEPIGGGKGPNPSRLVAAAAGHCLSASLFFCLSKAKVEGIKIRSSVSGRLARNERGRQRIGGMDVEIQLEGSGGQEQRMARCLELFEDFCIVTQSIRDGIAVNVRVVDEQGRELRPA